MEVPDFMVKLFAIFQPDLKALLPELGKPKNATSAKAERVLGWKPRSAADSIVATAESLIALKLV